jgi:hypothetical protein
MDSTVFAGGIIFLFLIIILAIVVFWVWMLVDALMSKSEDKLVWIIVLIFLGPVIGSLLYYFLGRNKK